MEKQVCSLSFASNETEPFVRNNFLNRSSLHCSHPLLTVSHFHTATNSIGLLKETRNQESAFLAPNENSLELINSTELRLYRSKIADPSFFGENSKNSSSIFDVTVYRILSENRFKDHLPPPEFSDIVELTATLIEQRIHDDK